MPSGGARPRSGPPPDRNALRRDRDHAEWRSLPTSGRVGDVPEWPLAGQLARERILWASEWSRPQAIVWEERGEQLQVALYVRAVVVAEGRKATAADRNVVLRYMDDLGLTQGGLARNRWTIESGEPAEKATPTDDPDRASAKSRLTAITGGAA